MTPPPDQVTAGTSVPVDPDLALPPPTPVGRDSTAGVAVMAHLRRQTAALLHADAGLPTDEPGAVHAGRVAARRLRSGLRMYGDLLLDDVSARLRPELTWYAGHLAPARDLEVFDAWLAGAEDEVVVRVAAAVSPWLRRGRAAALADAVAASRSERGEALRSALVAVARRPAFTPVAARRAAKVLGPRVLHADRRAATRLSGLGAESAGEAWHAARITAKRARYAAEVGAPALGRPCEDLARYWATLTEPLGDAQDALIQRELVLERVADPSAPLSAEEAFVCGVFVASTHDREVSAHRTAHAIWYDGRDHHRALRAAVAG